MKNKQNSRKRGRPYDQQKDESRCSLKYISKMIESLSVLCSLMGISLFGVTFFGVADVLDYRHIELLNECAHYMVISAVILFFVAFLLSFFQEDSKQNNPVVVHQTNVGGRVLFENSHSANVNTDNKTLRADNLKCTKSNTEVKQGTMAETVKPTNLSSETMKVVGISEQEGIGSRTLPSNISSKNPQYANTTNHRESKLHISSSILPKNTQHANTSKHGVIARPLSSNISSETLQHANTSKQGKNAKKLSTKSQSLNLNKELSNLDKQFIPYQQQFENLSHGQYIPRVLSPRVPSFSNFMSTRALQNRQAAEIVTTKKTTIFPGGVAQEEYRITRTAFYKCLWCPEGVTLDSPFCLEHQISSEGGLGSNPNNTWVQGGNISSESVSGQNVGNDNRWGQIGGISSQSALRPILDSPCFSGSRIFSESVLRSNCDSSWITESVISTQSALIPNLDIQCSSGSRISSEGILKSKHDSSWFPRGEISSQSALRPNLDWPCYSGSKISSESALTPNLDSSWFSDDEISSQSALGYNLHSPWYSEGMSSSPSVPIADINRPWYEGTEISFESVSRPNLDHHSDQHTMSSLVIHRPLKNKVSEVQTKLESMNILP